MAILMVKKNDKPTHGGADDIIKRFDRGHVLVAVDDNWKFGTSEVGNPELVFISVPGPAADYAYLTAERPDAGANAVAQPPRMKKLDMDMPAVKNTAAVASGKDRQGDLLPMSKTGLTDSVKDVVFAADFVIENPSVDGPV